MIENVLISPIDNNELDKRTEYIRMEILSMPRSQGELRNMRSILLR